MFVYQVLLLPCLLLALKLASAQCPQNLVYIINTQCVQSVAFCNAPYILQNGACVVPNVSQCANVNGQPGSPPTVQPQPSPCPIQPVYPFLPVQPLPGPCPNQSLTQYIPAQPAPCPNQPVYPYFPIQPQPVPCPNQPVTPYTPIQPLPNQPASPNTPGQSSPAPCPNQPVTPYPPIQLQPAPCPNQPVTPYPPVQPQPSPYPKQPNTPNHPIQPPPELCPNQPVIPYPPVNPQPSPYPNQPNTPYPPVQPQPEPFPNQPVSPYPPVHPQPTPYPPVLPQPEPCPNQPVTPYPPVQPQPTSYPNQPVTPYPPVQTQPTPYPNQAPTPYPPAQTQPTQEPTPSPTTIPTTSVTKEPSATPSPEPIRRCPEGTVLINGSCRLVYCGSGGYANGRCLQTRCPHGTAWTGQKCAPPKPIKLAPIHLERTIITQKSNESPDLVLNNVQNLVVNASIILPQDDEDYDEEYNEDSDEETAAPTPTKCCTVVAPRICRCQGQSLNWQCYNRKQQLCGDFCSASKVVLKPSKVTTWYDDNDEMLTIPPNWNFECRQQGNCTQTTGKRDCSGCASGVMTLCSSYCYSYHCNSHNCAFYDQQQFCELPQFTNSIVCRR